MDRREFMQRSAQVAMAGLSLPLLACGSGSGSSSGTGSAPATSDSSTASIAFETMQVVKLQTGWALDVHHHAVPKLYVDALAAKGITTFGGLPFPAWGPQTDIATCMDPFFIKAAVLSLSCPGTYFKDLGDAFAVDLSRRVNEYFASVVAIYPKRFRFVAALPMPLVDASIQEAVYALDALNADGIGLLASAGDMYLGDPAFEPLMQELNKRACVVMVHPNIHSSSELTGLTIPPAGLEFTFDTSRAMVNLIWNGVLTRYPKITWIFAHAGGVVPYLAWRMDLLYFTEHYLEMNGSLKAPSAFLNDLYYDTALSMSQYAMSACLLLAGAGHILFGSDYPFSPFPVVGDERYILACNVINNDIGGFFTQEVHNQIISGAGQLFPQLGV
ncbi:MAG: amidohydrolase family protein [Syntrophaceae bacterium]